MGGHIHEMTVQCQTVITSTAHPPTHHPHAHTHTHTHTHSKAPWMSYSTTEQTDSPQYTQTPSSNPSSQDERPLISFDKELANLSTSSDVQKFWSEQANAPPLTPAQPSDDFLDDDGQDDQTGRFTPKLPWHESGRPPPHLVPLGPSFVTSPTALKRRLPPDQQLAPSDCGSPVGSEGFEVPGLHIPGLQAPGLHAPGLHAPGLQAPGLHIPGLQAPGLHAPGLHAPGLQAPGLQAPGLQAPGLHIPGLQAPGLHAPGLQAPGSVCMYCKCLEKPPHKMSRLNHERFCACGV